MMQHPVSMVRRLVSARFLRFCVVGLCGFLTDAGLLHAILHLIGPHPIMGRMVSIPVAMTVTWALNRSFTFAHPEPPSFREWGKYLAVNAVGAGVNFAAYSLLIWLMPIANLAVRAWVSVAVASVVAMGVNYLGMKHAVFNAPDSQ